MQALQVLQPKNQKTDHLSPPLHRLSLSLTHIQDPEISLDNVNGTGHISFKGKAHSHATGPEEHGYSIELDLFGEIDPADSKQATTDRTILLIIAKKEEGPHWPRLLKEKGKVPQYIKTDWSKWVDEDDEEEAAAAGGGDAGDMMGGLPPGFDMSQLQNFTNFNAMGGGDGGGMGGMPGGGDMASMMAGMGMGGMGGMDADAMAGMGLGGGDSDDDEEEEDDMPELVA